MFETMVDRAAARAERQARRRTADLAERLRAELPGGVRATAAPEGVVLSGRGLSRRLAAEPALRWLLASVR